MKKQINSHNETGLFCEEQWFWPERIFLLISTVHKSCWLGVLMYISPSNRLVPTKNSMDIMTAQSSTSMKKIVHNRLELLDGATYECLLESWRDLFLLLEQIQKHVILFAAVYIKLRCFFHLFFRLLSSPSCSNY